MDGSIDKELPKRLSKLGIVLAADIDFSQAEDIDTGLLVSRISDLYKDYPANEGLKIIDGQGFNRLIAELKSEKVPAPVEISAPTSFSPAASGVRSHFSFFEKKAESTSGTVSDFVEYFNDRLRKIKKIIEAERGSSLNPVPNLEVVSKFPSGRELCAVGVVRSRITTKNGNMMVVIEDDKSTVKVIFMNGTSERAKALFAKSGTIMNDEVLAVKGKVSGPFLIANELIWPDIPIREQKHSEDDVAVAFASDIHVGSKLFLEKSFTNMIRWLNGDFEKKKDLAGKVKYLMIGGDNADGIGIYPNQDRDLAVSDYYAQYRMLFKLLENVPDYIEIFMIPGNHDSVQLSEPQPPIEHELAKDFANSNLHLLSNPTYVNFDGVNVLAYHGASLDSVIASVPGMSYAAPEKAMIEILKRRHLSPIYGGNTIVPSKNDNLVIERIPDVLFMGHIHKNGFANYHGVDIVNSGTWQTRTDYQIKQGHIPTPGILPVLELKSRVFNFIDFNTP